LPPYSMASSLVEARPASALSWFGVGCYYHAAGNHERAGKFFGKATAMDMRFVPAAGRPGDSLVGNSSPPPYLPKGARARLHCRGRLGECVFLHGMCLDARPTARARISIQGLRSTPPPPPHSPGLLPPVTGSSLQPSSQPSSPRVVRKLPRKSCIRDGGFECRPMPSSYHRRLASPTGAPYGNGTPQRPR